MMMNILGVHVSPTSYSTATTQIRTWVEAGESRSINATGVHGVMEAHDSPDFRKILNCSDMNTPDGMPLVWMLRLKGVKDQMRVYGPTLMLHVLEMAGRELIPVGFYGGDTDVMDKLVKTMETKYPGLNIAYSYSPPFRALSSEEDNEVCINIQKSRIRILFVGLGCPKQEIWMAEHKGKLPAVMLGVGAAFDFLAGRKPQAPKWMQAIGLEWLFRLMHEPRRLARRYLYNNPRFVLLALADLLGILGKGKKEA